MLEKYNDRLVAAVYSRITGNLEEYTMDSTIGRDIGRLYKDVVSDVLKVKVWVCTYEASDGKYQIEFYFDNLHIPIEKCVLSDTSLKGGAHN